MQDRFEAFKARLTGCDIWENIPLAQYTSFRTGGNARLLIEPQSASALLNGLRTACESGIPYEVIGNGTNLLVSDEGVDAAVFRISSGMGRISNEGSLFYAEAGALLTNVAKQSVSSGFMGLEWAAGIPGSVGGAIAMNAGAYGGEIAHVLHKVVYIDMQRHALVEAVPQPGDLAYRFSRYSAPERIIVSAEFSLMPDDGSAATRMDEYARRRREKQPLAYPSAGSTFKRPEGNFAGSLIEQAGLKGARIGGAEVSTLHAGFIVNAGGATSADIYALICHVQQAVQKKNGILLEPEVRLLGRFTEPMKGEYPS